MKTVSRTTALEPGTSDKCCDYLTQCKANNLGQQSIFDCKGQTFFSFSGSQKEATRRWRVVACRDVRNCGKPSSFNNSPWSESITVIIASRTSVDRRNRSLHCTTLLDLVVHCSVVSMHVASQGILPCKGLGCFCVLPRKIVSMEGVLGGRGKGVWSGR